MGQMLLINFKTYEQATGAKAVKLAKAAEAAARGKKADVVLAVQATDIERVSKAVSIPVYAQHMDDITPGSHTGWMLPEALKEAGARGTLINHSEHPVDAVRIKACIAKCREMGFVSVCCAPTPEKAREIAAFGPDFIAVEPPELIGGEISVSKARPEVIKDTVDAVRKVNGKVKVLCGAGVHDREDVAKAAKLGASGVLVASGIVKSPEPGKVILDLIGGF